MMRRRKLAISPSIPLYENGDDPRVVKKRRRQTKCGLRDRSFAILLLAVILLVTEVPRLRSTAHKVLARHHAPRLMVYPVVLPSEILWASYVHDFGELDIEFSEYHQREISPDDEHRFTEERGHYLENIDYYVRGQESEEPPADSPFDPEEPCRENKHQWDYQPNCLYIHEEVALEHAHFLGHGEFRQAWLIKDGTKKLVVKTYVDDADGNGVDHAGLRDVARDANIMEKLTFSPLIVNMYGICALTVVVEALDEVTDKIVPIPSKHKSKRGRIRKTPLDNLQKNGLHPMNNLTATEKLDYALAMAESLAELHGYSGGLINHGDVWIDQWMRNDEGTIVLGDFNVGFFTQWNENKNEYCPFQTTDSGSYTAPEELTGGMSTEGCDMFSFGLALYSILTGLYPMYDTTNIAVEQKRFIDGEMPYIDPRYRTRSTIEAALADVLLECLKYKPEDRISIFAVVKFLRDLKHAESLKG